MLTTLLFGRTSRRVESVLPLAPMFLLCLLNLPPMMAKELCEWLFGWLKRLFVGGLSSATEPPASFIKEAPRS